jgi:short-subunit dehydrogenase
MENLRVPQSNWVAPLASAWTRYQNTFLEDILSLRVNSTAPGNWFGKWALITGASAGIGVALAEELASGGTNLVLTARRKDRLDELARRLTAAHKVRSEIFPADLADPTAPEKIFSFTKEKGIEIDLLINNAGFGAYGEFHSVEKQRLLDMVQVNCHAVVHLTRLYLPEMVARRRGDILILASTASFQAVPYISTYAATKAFDLLFAEGLAEEMKPYGIRVCALCPGSTETEFHIVSGQEKFKRNAETAEKVAHTGLKALAAGKSYVISGLGNYLGAHGERLVPRRFVTKIAANMFKPEKK